MSRSTVVALGVALWVGAGVLTAWSEESVPPTRSSRAPRAKPASPTLMRAKPTGALNAKLDQVMANDQQILARFDAIMEELRIVKIRVLRAPQGGTPR